MAIKDILLSAATQVTDALKKNGTGSKTGTTGGTATSATSSTSGSSGGTNQKYVVGANQELDAKLKKYSDAYSASRNALDAHGMQEANDSANQLKNQYGYAADFATDDINYIRGQSGSGSGSSGGSGLYNYSTATTPQYPYGYSSLEDLKDALGYTQQSEAEQAAIDAYIKQQVNSLSSQKSDINQSADDMARQAYISYMQSADKMPQALAAAGYSGGMADSQRLALESQLQNNQNQIAMNRDSAITDVDTAINNAKLEGSIQGAQAQAQLGQEAITAYNNYVNQQNTLANQDFWSRYGYDYQADQAQKNRDWQSAQNDTSTASSTAATTQKQAYDTAWNLMLAGQIPSDDLLSAAGISKTDAQAYAAEVQRQAAKNSKTNKQTPKNDTETPSTTKSKDYDSIKGVLSNLLRRSSSGNEQQAATQVASYLDKVLSSGSITQAEQEDLAAYAASVLFG